MTHEELVGMVIRCLNQTEDMHPDYRARAILALIKKMLDAWAKGSGEDCLRDWSAMLAASPLVPPRA